MQIPIRKKEQSQRYADAGGPVYLTAPAIERLKRTLHDLEKRELPPAIADVQRLGEMGDFSENAAYQEAKARMRRIHARIATLRDRLNRAQVIETRKSGFVSLGSTVILSANGKEQTFEIVGPAETNPARGRISHLSPLGVALMNHAKGDEVHFKASGKETIYKILEIR